MDPKAFTSDRAGRLIAAPTGYHAFVPRPLPPELQWGPQLVGRLSDADRAIGELRGARSLLKNPMLLARPFLSREAVLSSRIEGTQASLADLLFFEASSVTGASPSDVHEVANYFDALDYAFEPGRQLPVSLRLIRELHRILMRGVRGAHLTPGEFRTSQNWIGAPGCTLNEATYVPPPVPQLQEGLHDLERYLHAADTLPPLVRLGIVHYQFEALHPFLDGNGRVGRLLISLLLGEWHVLDTPLLYLSAFFEQHRQEYYDRLLAVSLRGDWEGWLSYFLEGVRSQALDASRRAQQLAALRDELVARVSKTRSSSSLVPLIDALVSNPVTTVPRAAKVTGLSYQGAQHNINKLVKLGMLTRFTRKQRPQPYVARDVLALLDDGIVG